MGPSESEPSIVTAGEISRNFGQWQDRALSGPVIVTHHGRPRVVLISADRYAALKDEGPLGFSEADQHSFETSQSAILDHMAEAFMALNAQLQVTAVNHVFEALVGLSASQIVGRLWADLFPPIARSIMGEQLKRTLRTGEALDFEAISDGPEGRRYGVRAFPYPGGVAVLMQNRTAERELQANLQEARALEEALSQLPQVMILRLNIRGVITEVNKDFADLVGFSIQELMACRLPDIARPRDRAELTASLEKVLRGSEPLQLTTTLLVKNGGELSVRIGVASIIHDLVPDGLVAAVTLAGPGGA